MNFHTAFLPGKCMPGPIVWRRLQLDARSSETIGEGRQKEAERSVGFDSLHLR